MSPTWITSYPVRMSNVRVKQNYISTNNSVFCESLFQFLIYLLFLPRLEFSTAFCLLEFFFFFFLSLCLAHALAYSQPCLPFLSAASFLLTLLSDYVGGPLQAFKLSNKLYACHHLLDQYIMHSVFDICHPLC